MSSPWPTVAICLCYALVSLRLGPGWARGRRALEARAALVAYNAAQVAVSATLFYWASKTHFFIKKLCDFWGETRRVDSATLFYWVHKMHYFIKNMWFFGGNKKSGLGYSVLLGTQNALFNKKYVIFWGKQEEWTRLLCSTGQVKRIFFLNMCFFVGNQKSGLLLLKTFWPYFLQCLSKVSKFIRQRQQRPICRKKVHKSIFFLAFLVRHLRPLLRVHLHLRPGGLRRHAVQHEGFSQNYRIKNKKCFMLL